MRYAKLIAAALGLLAIVIKDYANVEITGETIDNITLAIITLLGVWKVKNGEQ